MYQVITFDGDKLWTLPKPVHLLAARAYFNQQVSAHNEDAPSSYLGQTNEGRQGRCDHYLRSRWRSLPLKALSAKT